MVIVLYATVTRGAYLALACGVVFIALVRNRKLLLPLLGLVLLVYLFAPPYVQERIRSIGDMNHPENSIRLLLWSTALKIFADHPVVGVGDIDLHEVIVRYTPPDIPITWGHLHSVPLQLLVTLGLPGFIAALAMFVRIVVAEWAIYKTVAGDWFGGSLALGSLALLVGFHIIGLTEWSFGDQEVVLTVWTSVGLTLAVGGLADTRARDST
jgi:O-antigen ligase